MSESKSQPEIQPEIEATFINIDKDQLRAQLKELSAKLLQPETLMRRTIFNIDDRSFVRVRDEGNRITMSYKRLDKLSLSGMKEICLDVNDYDDAINFVKVCGLNPKAVQETLREEWELDGVELDIDTWPWLPTFVEIEGPSEAAVKSVAEKLGLEIADALYGSVDEVYKIYYDVTNQDINYCPEIKFTDAPDWLVSKRRAKPLHIPRNL